VLLLSAAVGACNPIDTYRHLVGNDKNDPDPATTPNTGNLAAGEAQDYPNLATVPAPPTRAMSEADRKKLTQSLVSDRSNAAYTSEKLQPGFAPGGAPPPPPPPPPPPAAAGAGAVAAPAPPPPPPAVAAAENPAPAASAAPNPRAPRAAAAAPAVPFSGAPKPDAAPAPQVASAAPAAGQPASGRRKPGEPPEPGPMESNLQAPQVGATPQPGAPRPPPSAPPQVSWSSAAPAPSPSPAAVASAAPQPSPAPPTPTAPLPPTPPQGSAKPSVPFVATTVATIDFAGSATALVPGDRAAVARAAAAFKQSPGMLRVVAYAAATAAGAGQAQLASFQTALDRAQAVAAALKQAGVPADKVQTQAAPAEPAKPAGRVEIRLLH